jgi:hypothetical protein
VTDEEKMIEAIKTELADADLDTLKAVYIMLIRSR